MKELEKHGMKNTQAYVNAKYYLSEVSELSSGETFSRKKTGDIDALGEELKQASKFLRSDTSTVIGEKQRRSNKAFETLVEKGTLDIPEIIEVPKDFSGTRTEYFKQKFFQFLDQDAWKDIKKHIGGGGTNGGYNALQEAGEAIAKGAEIKDLNKAYRKYLKGEIDIYTMWDDWTNVEK